MTDRKAGVRNALAVGAAAVVTLGLRGATMVQESADQADLEARARDLHAEAIVIDGHNDLPWRIREEAGLDFAPLGLDSRQPAGHTDMVRLREGGVDAQFWAAYVPAENVGAQSTVTVLEQIDLIKRLAAAFPDHLEMAYTAADIRRIAEEGRVASLIGIEGGHTIANSLPVLRELYGAGARYMTLTHSRTLAWADAAGDEPTHGGLTDFGRAVVREMNRLGMLVDLSHVTPEVMRDALEVAEAPVIFSHSSARAIADHPRNVPDDVLRRLPANGGVVMVNFYSAFLVPEAARIRQDLFRELRRLREQYPDDEEYERAKKRWQADHRIPAGTVGTIVDHIDHIARVAGIDHVGLGSDFDGVSKLPQGMEDVSRFPAITLEMLRRGYGDEDVKKVLGGNLLRVLEEAERAAARLQREGAPAIERLPFHGAVAGPPGGS
ncbi:MAG: dipeptidase [Gemmatimonadota bacterium]